MFRDIQQFLRRTLIGNAVFSTASALVCIAAAPSLATQIAMAPKQFVALGVQLLVFAAILAFLGTRSRLDHGGVLSAVIFFGIADLLWVVGSAKGLQAGIKNPHPAIRMRIDSLSSLLTECRNHMIYLPLWFLVRQPGDPSQASISQPGFP